MNDVLDKVQKLIDKAWATTFEHERESLLAKAEELMQKYSIEQFLLQDPARPNTASIKYADPEIRKFWYYGEGNEGYAFPDDVRSSMVNMVQYLTDHFRIRRGRGSFYYSNCLLVGYPADLDFFEMMFVGLKLHLMSHLEPKVVLHLPWQDNLAALKNSGRKWEEIHNMLQAHPAYPYPGPWRRITQLTAVYRRWCELNLSDPEMKVVASPDQWRRGVVQGYVRGIRDRLEDMRNKVEQNSQSLALFGEMKSQLDLFYEERFPEPPPGQFQFAPSTEKVRRGRVAAYRPPKVSYAAQEAGRRIAQTADLSGGGRLGK